LARQAASQGRVQEAVSLLSQGILQEQSGRGRFQRKIELAGICMSTKNETLAYPILNEIAEEIEQRKLEEWEEPATLARALGLLLRCLEKMGADEVSKQKVFQKICRLDPMQAFTSMRS
jgi:type VI secretion system protein ImpA